jgi:hypothetical protein
MDQKANDVSQTLPQFAVRIYNVQPPTEISLALANTLESGLCGILLFPKFQFSLNTFYTNYLQTYMAGFQTNILYVSLPFVLHTRLISSSLVSSAS